MVPEDKKKRHVNILGDDSSSDEDWAADHTIHLNRNLGRSR